AAAAPVRGSGAFDRPGYIGRQLDLDAATRAQIESLPGVGPTLARRIVADRRDHGPFISKEVFVRRIHGIPRWRLDDLDSLVTYSGRLEPDAEPAGSLSPPSDPPQSTGHAP